MSETEVVAVIDRIFSETLSITPPAPDVDIIDAALLDSLGLVTLLFEIEQELGLQMPLESLEVDDFRSIGLIAQLIVRMQSGKQGNVFEEGDGPVDADMNGAQSA
ncbi:MAG TPA: phosphopantetheine-binding protein [Solirubrobacteraceae bacterium]